MGSVALKQLENDYCLATEEAIFANSTPQQILARVFDRYNGQIAAVSSFGTESAVLLGMIAEVDPSTPVIFLDTGYMFPETLAYRDTLVERLGLRDVRSVTPDPDQAAAQDPDNALWAEDVDACCALRKVAPLAKALGPFAAWINGRKRYHGDERAKLGVMEIDGPRVKINPLARFTRSDINAYFNSHQLPRHPLEAAGYLSIGCMPCSSRTLPGENIRDGRWRGRAKTECGIHVIHRAPNT